MKKNLALILILFSALAFGQAKKNEKAVIKTTFYCSHCLECETCGKKFNENLYQVNGLKMFSIDDKKMLITVYFDGRKTSVEAIRTAIANLGFDADQVKANPKAYDQLDDCCKKT
jgi:periplasmic mercuric ion binding protein